MVLDRIKEFIDFKGITISAFEKSIGMSNASFGKTLKSKGAIGTDKLENILKVYPDLSIIWLLTGSGNMLNSNEPEKTPQPDINNVYINSLMQMIREKDEIIRKQAEEIGHLKTELDHRGQNAEDVQLDSVANAG